MSRSESAARRRSRTSTASSRSTAARGRCLNSVPLRFRFGRWGRIELRDRYLSCRCGEFRVPLPIQIGQQFRSTLGGGIDLEKLAAGGQRSANCLAASLRGVYGIPAIAVSKIGPACSNGQRATESIVCQATSGLPLCTNFSASDLPRTLESRASTSAARRRMRGGFIRRGLREGLGITEIDGTRERPLRG